MLSHYYLNIFEGIGLSQIDRGEYMHRPLRQYSSIVFVCRREGLIVDRGESVLMLLIVELVGRYHGTLYIGEHA